MDCKNLSSLQSEPFFIYQNFVESHYLKSTIYIFLFSGYKPANKKQQGGKPGPKDLKPPDLWMDHDQMELKNLDSGMSGVTTLPSGDKAPDVPGGGGGHHGGQGEGMLDVRRNSFISKCAVPVAPAFLFFSVFF